MVNSTALMVIDPEKAIADSKARKDIVVAMREKNILRQGIDFGVIPGTDKPTLLKPGAERLCAAFGLDPRFETITAIEQWDDDNPLFFYRVMCRLIHIETGLEVATGIGSCNSREGRYRWRWVEESKLPPHLDKAKLEIRNATLGEFKFAIDKAETSGKYGKSPEHWKAFQDAIANDTARKSQRTTARGLSDYYEIGGVQYRVPNDDIFSLVNTLDKIAQKRALIGAALIGANASEHFTQDIEDMPGFGLDVIEGTFEEVTIIEPPGDSQKKFDDRPPPPKFEKKLTAWATQQQVGQLVSNAANTLGLTWLDVKRYTGIDKQDDYAAWNAKYPSRGAAADAIKDGHAKDMADLKPAEPKARVEEATT
jgi:hypothetical protein